MRKIEVRMVQDTPMWHFQGASEDCCLRASEVKPKLDRFLVTKIGRGEIPDSWWINKEQGALNYKMRISVSGREILESLVTDKGRDGRPRFDNNGNPKMKNLYPIYFGNMGPNAPRNMRLVKFEGIKLEIIVPNEVAEKKTDENASDKTLGDIISENLPQFFAGTSFGTRQDKGFGCFTVESIIVDGKEISTGKTEIPECAAYCFTVPKCEYPDLFQHINYFHKVIRSGVNERGCYVKSLMYKFVESEKKGVWDKPVIRSKFHFRNALYQYICKAIDYKNLNGYDQAKLTHKGNRHPVRQDMAVNEYKKRDRLSSEKNLWRDALGLATSQDWVFYGSKVKTVLHGNAGEEVRFKSPIDYRPIPSGNGGFEVYVILHELPTELRKATFDISANESRGSKRPLGVGELSGMHIANEMSIVEYFEYIESQKKSVVAAIRQWRTESEPDKFIKQVFLTFRKIK